MTSKEFNIIFTIIKKQKENQSISNENTLLESARIKVIILMLQNITLQ